MQNNSLIPYTCQYTKQKKLFLLPSHVTHLTRGGVVVPPPDALPNRPSGGSLRSPPGGFAACSAYGGACGGRCPHSPRELGRVPAPLRGPPVPVAPPSVRRRGFFGVLGLGPPLLRSLAAPSGRLAALRFGLAPGLGPWPLRGRWPRLGSPPPGAGRARAAVLVVAFRRCPRLRGRCGLSAGRLRPLRRVRRSPRPRRCGGGWGLPPPASARLRLRPRPCGSGSPALGACRPLRGRCASAAGALRPCCVLAGSPLGFPFGRPGFRPGAPPLRPSGGRLGAAAPPLSPPPPPSVRSIRRSGCGQGLRKWPFGHP